MNKFVEAVGGLFLAACIAVAFVAFMLALMAIGIAIPTFIGWFMGLVAAWLFGPWLENGVQELFNVQMSLDVLGAVLGFIFGIARLGLSAAAATVSNTSKKDK
jgi:hypothetical protein